MPEIGDSSPLTPLLPVNPSKPAGQRVKPKTKDEKNKRRRSPERGDADSSRPHIDDYA